MKVYTPENIRNLALIGHSTVGKTTLAEAILFAAGETNRQGSVDDGSTLSDYNSDEITRKISINTSLLHCEWKERKLNIIDVPGYSDFIGEVTGAMRVADMAVIVLNAIAGVEVGTENAWKRAGKAGVSGLFFVNRLDKENADFDKALAAIQDRFNNKGIVVNYPINAGEGFDSIVDLMTMQLIKYEKDGSGKFSAAPIPENHKARASELREKMVEMAAENDDQLLEKFFEEGELTSDEVKRGLQAGIVKQAAFPVLSGSAASNIGVKHLMDFLVDYGTAPTDRPAEVCKAVSGGGEVERACKADGPLAMIVFKTVSEAHIGEMSFFKVVSGQLESGTEVQNTSRGVSEKIGQIYLLNGKNRKEIGMVNAGDIAATVKLKDTHTGNTLSTKKEQVVLPGIDFPAPVIRIAVEPRSKGDEDKISTGLHMLHEQDPTFLVNYDPELAQTIISGQGELHLDIVVRRLQEKFGVEVNLVEPKIPYRETIRGSAQTQHKYKKQTGGRGQYGDVWVKVEPLQSGEGFEFEDKIVGGVIPGKFIPAVEKGVREAMVEGVMAGYPVIDVRVSLYDGSYHNVDSSEMAFKIAGSMAFKKAIKQANPVLLEPIYDVEVVVPEEYMGDVMGDISGRRGKISGMDSEGPFQIVKAKVPLAELYKYSTSLRSITHGRGLHRRKFSHYETVPADITQKLIAATQEESEKR